MSKTKQFLTLFKFQAFLNPVIWFMPLAFAMPLFFTHTFAHYHPSLISLLNVQNLFLVGIVGVWAIAPDMAQASGGSNLTAISGTEFLLTRAVDRVILYRVRAIYLYVVVLLIPLITLFVSLKSPGLVLGEDSKPIQDSLMQALPGSSLRPNPDGGSPLLFVPNGSVWIEAWHLWLFIFATMSVQVLIFILARLPYRRFLFYVLYMGFIFVPMIYDIRSIGKDAPSREESLFFYFASHPALFGLITVAAVIAVQFWCEWRFARQEQ